MALDWGVDARLIAGDAGGPHAWNIVKMGDYYYNLDSTWDAGLRPNYMWFLKCPDTFVNHYRDFEYSTSEFNAAYPMGAADYVYNESDFVEEPVLGDVDGDAVQTVEDVYMIRLVVAKLAELTDEQKNAADLDGDGKITAIDANILRKYILGIITEIPVAAG
jgi:hypothetical protein